MPRKNRKREYPLKKRAMRSKTDKMAMPYPVPAPPSASSIGEQARIEESKYYSGVPIQKFEAERGFEFPYAYGDNRIVLMVRDPYWIFTYWEVSEKKLSEIKTHLGSETYNKCTWCLRVYKTDKWEFFDINLPAMANNWYINVPYPNSSYCVEIGVKTSDGRFIAAARSNIVTTPPDRMSDVIDEEWMIPDWERMYRLSGGFGLRSGSESLKELIEKRLKEESASGWISSISSPMKKPGKRPFWSWVEAELVIYGATEPTATVMIDGKKVPLRPDGTFTLRYALPDGQQNFPVVATRDDGAEKRRVDIEVERKTNK